MNAKIKLENSKYLVTSSRRIESPNGALSTFGTEARTLASVPKVIARLAKEFQILDPQFTMHPKLAQESQTLPH